MNTTKQLAKHLRELYFGANWTCVNFEDTLNDITWQEAITKYQDFNTIAVLIFHSNYYINRVLKVLEGESLNASDKYSFDCPEITSNEEWENFVQKTMNEAELFAIKIENLDESKLDEIFFFFFYGDYFWNILGIIEHAYYHLGQIALIKKCIRQKG